MSGARDSDDMATRIRKLHQAGYAHRVPLVRAAAAGLPVFEASRETSMGAFKRWAAAAPDHALALIGDDDGADPDGPDTWPIARRMLAWARFVVLNGTGGEPVHYETGIALASLIGRLLFVECGSRHLQAWTGAAERWASPNAGGMVIQPPAGADHPVMPAREHLH